MTNPEQYIKPCSLAQIAGRYGIYVATLKDMIRIDPELAELIKPYQQERKRLLPISIVQKIYEKLGYPDTTVKPH